MEQQDQQPAPESEKKHERASKHPKSRARKILARAGLAMLVLFLVASLAGVDAFLYLYATTKLPDPNSDFTINTAFIYYNSGQKRPSSLAVQSRITLGYGKMPQVVKNAVMAAENSTFFSDLGFSTSGMLCGLWTIARGGNVQGGSTITQQYVKILYLSSERTMGHKIRELILTVKMGRKALKEKILEGYLNTIYLGRGTYGIEAAAKSHFPESASGLSLSEAATLAAILNNPADLSPSVGKKSRGRLLGRYQYVLDQVLENKYISRAEHNAAYPALPEFPEVPVSDRYGGPEGFLVSQVEQELSGLDFSDAGVQGGGLKVTTILDKSIQDAAVATAQKCAGEAVSKVKPWQDVSKLHVVISSVDTTTGGVLAVYDGSNYAKDSCNWPTTPRPAVSAFKSFATVVGLHSGYSLNSTLKGDTFTPRGDGIPVRNEFSERYGDVTLRRAVAESINTAFVDMTESMRNGAPVVIQTTNDAGAPSGTGWNVSNRITLGATEVSPLNMANACATLAGSEKRKDIHFVAKMVDRDGNTVYGAKKEGTQAVGENVATNITDALTSVVEGDTDTKVSQLKRPATGKARTDDVDDPITFAWFIGYTRQISTAVMYIAGDPGNENLDAYKKPGDKTFFGSSYPLTTWVGYMQTATEGREAKRFDRTRPIQGKSSAPSQAPTRSARPTSAQPTQGAQPTQEPSYGSGQPTSDPTDAGRPTSSTQPTRTKSQAPITQPTGGGKSTQQPTGGGDKPTNPDDGERGPDGGRQGNDG